MKARVSVLEILWSITIWASCGIGFGFAQDLCVFSPEDPWPAPVRTNGVLNSIDIDGDEAIDLTYKVYSDGLFVTVYKLETSEAAVFLIHDPASGRFREGDKIGGEEDLVYIPPDNSPGLYLNGVAWQDFCEPNGCYLYSSQFGELRSVTVGYIGVRLKSSNGYHYGWMKFGRECASGYVPFEMISYSINPIPGVSITAGEVPKPRLDIVYSDGTAHVSWRPEWKGWHLESTSILNSDAKWSVVPNVVGNQIVVNSNQGSLYFRLVSD